MPVRGIYDRNGEALGTLNGDRIYDLNGEQTGVVRGRVVYDLQGERRWWIDGDALLDRRANVIGYLTDPVWDEGERV